MDKKDYEIKRIVDLRFRTLTRIAKLKNELEQCVMVVTALNERLKQMNVTVKTTPAGSSWEENTEPAPEAVKETT